MDLLLMYVIVVCMYDIMSYCTSLLLLYSILYLYLKILIVLVVYL